METGGSSSSNSNLTASVEGADLIIDEAMTNITFQYNASGTSGSGSGSAGGSGSGSSSSSAFAYANDKVSTSTFTTCSILDNGDLKCWGRDSYGQLGNGGSNSNTNVPPSNSINLGTGRTAVAVSAGSGNGASATVCAILDNGDVKCWGTGFLGYGGNITNTSAPLSTAVDLGSGPNCDCDFRWWSEPYLCYS